MYIIQSVDVHIGNILVFWGSAIFGIIIRVSGVQVPLPLPFFSTAFCSRFGLGLFSVQAWGARWRRVFLFCWAFSLWPPCPMSSVLLINWKRGDLFWYVTVWRIGFWFEARHDWEAGRCVYLCGLIDYGLEAGAKRWKWTQQSVHGHDQQATDT